MNTEVGGAPVAPVRSARPTKRREHFCINQPKPRNADWIWDATCNWMELDGIVAYRREKGEVIGGRGF